MIEYRLKDGTVMYGFNKSEDVFISGMLSRGRLWRARESSELCKLFQSVEGSADFLDVGANIGTWTIPLARCLRSLGKGGRVIAVEGVQSVAEYLQASVLRNSLAGDVDVYSYAVGDGTTAASEMTMYVDPRNKAASSAVRRPQGAVPVSARAATLDSLLAGSGARVFGMKLDVEGSEGRALRGARRLLEEPPCALSLRLGARALAEAGTSVREVLTTLWRAGYDLAVPPEEPEGLTALFAQRDFEGCAARFREVRAPPQPLVPAALPAQGRGRAPPPSPDGGPRATAPHAELALTSDDSEWGGNGTDDTPPALVPRPLGPDAVRSAAAAVGTVDYTMRGGEIVCGFEAAEDRFISGMLARGRLWRARESGDMCRLFREVEGRADFADVGASIGTWTVPMARCLQSTGLGGRVIAIEGVPSIAHHLAASVVRNDLVDGVDLYNYAVGDVEAGVDGVARETMDQITMYVDPTNKGGSSIVVRAENATNATANLTSLDRVLSTAGARVFGMKLAVEGYEAQALRGARQLLERRPPCVLSLELSRRLLERAGAALQDVVDMLRAAGYEIPESERAPVGTRGLYFQKDFERCRARFRGARPTRPGGGEGRAERAPPQRLATRLPARPRAAEGDSADTGFVDVSCVHEPRPVPQEAMRSIVPAEQGMAEFRMRDGTVVYGFDVSEDRFISGALARGRLWRSRESSEFCEHFQHLRGRADFLDVGAHVGTWTLPLGRCLQSLGQGGRAIAVEGAAATAERLEASVVRNGLEHVVEVFDYVAGDGRVAAGNAVDANETGRVGMYLDPANRGGSSLVVRPDNAIWAEASMTTLDDIVARAGAKVFGMKIDVEGFEGHALRGAARLLADEPPCILNVELNRRFLARAGTEVRELLAMLRGAGYDVPADSEPSNAREVYFQRDFERCQARFDEDAAAANGTRSADTTTLAPAGAVHTTTPEAVRLVDVGLVRDPQPVLVDAMRGIEPAARGMVEYRMGDSMTIYGFNKSEDVFVSGALAKGRLWESRSSRDFCKLFQAVGGRADFLDVGANIGTWTLPLARCLRSHGKRGKVVAVEGMRPIAEHLEASVVRNNLTDVVDVYDYAVGDGFATTVGTATETPGEVTMSLDPANKGGSSLVNQAENATSVRSLMTTLDSVLARSHGRVFAMKMDIEGYEGHALKGATRLLGRPPCVLSIELNRRFLSRAGTPIEEVVGLLRDAGFAMPEYERWPSLSSSTYYQRDWEACVARFQPKGAVELHDTAEEAEANQTEGGNTS